ncbi:hypothetical protein BC937DRAFT_91364 [Endogone sp. FLAS-F59071]|nr:hypothetical protein BC937DRAFT_91364 [Endogone sp. FLAS-F59071]|eukprot:RUS16319.1 hypothetical protein BC937DRAFT_91364 [Endogone sp. FLAS-F59071]
MNHYIYSLLLVIFFLLIPLLFFTIGLPLYAYRRKYLLLNTGSMGAMTIWYLGIPITMCFTTALIAYCTFKQDPEENVITPTQSLQNMDAWDLSPHNPATPSKPLPSQLDNQMAKAPRPSQAAFELQMNLYLNPIPFPKRVQTQEKLDVLTPHSALGASSSRFETTSWQDFEMRIQDSSLLPSPLRIIRPSQRSISSFRSFQNHFDLSRNQPVQDNEKQFPGAARGGGSASRIQLKRNSVESVESVESVKSFETFGAASNVMYDDV